MSSWCFLYVLEMFPGWLQSFFQDDHFKWKIQRNSMIPNYSMIPAIRWSPAISWSPAIWWSPVIRWSIGSMDFDNPTVIPSSPMVLFTHKVARKNKKIKVCRFSAVNLMLMPRSYPASPLSPRLPLTASQIIAWVSHSAKYGISRLSDVQPHIFIDFIEFQHIFSLDIGRSSSKFE